METYSVRLKGRRPLIQHNPAAIGKPRERGGNIPEPAEEAEAALYRSADGTIIMPSLHILAAMKKAAVDFKVPGKGRKTYMGYIYAGVEISPFEIPLLHGENGHAPEWVIDVRPAVIQRARIMRARPMFPSWAVEFQLELLDPIITPEAIKTILEDAGKFQSLSDHRPLFGLFTVEKFEKSD